MIRLVLFGRQGAGKGTQASMLSKHYGAPHISTGDMLRESVNAGSELGRRVKEILDAGAHPIVDMSMEGEQAAFYSRASDEQLGWVAPPLKWAMEHADARVRILSDTTEV